MRKVNLQIMRPWIANKVTELVGFEDDLVIEYAMGLLEDTSQPVRKLCHEETDICTDHLFSISSLILVRCRLI